MSPHGQAAVNQAEVDADAGKDTLFDKIVRGVIPCDKIYEDELSIAFRDISPQVPP
jgi:hypothetical protein